MAQPCWPAGQRTGFKVSSRRAGHSRYPTTVVAQIIIIIIMRAIKIIMMMVVVVSNVEIFVIIGCLLVSKSKQIDAREMPATHVCPCGSQQSVAQFAQNHVLMVTSGNIVIHESIRTGCCIRPMQKTSGNRTGCCSLHSVCSVHRSSCSVQFAVTVLH